MISGTIQKRTMSYSDPNADLGKTPAGRSGIPGVSRPKNVAMNSLTFCAIFFAFLGTVYLHSGHLDQSAESVIGETGPMAGTQKFIIGGVMMNIAVFAVFGLLTAKAARWKASL